MTRAPHRTRTRGTRLVLVGLLLLAAVPGRSADPHALWTIVHGRCVPAARSGGVPGPCAVLDQRDGYAVLKDRVGAEQFLLIPTARLAGIESPALLRAGGPNYFADAWSQAALVGRRLHRELPREDLALAINSAYGRSQDQLHIHIDCVSRPVRAALAAGLDAIGTGWHPMPLAGHRYRARRIVGAALGANDPFRLLAASLDDPAHQMGRHTLVLVGARFPAAGFILLDDEVDLPRLDRASGEELQDHACAVAAS